ncbi:hypothetical protein Dimus_016943 [Dionaea muscipula]
MEVEQSMKPDLAMVKEMWSANRAELADSPPSRTDWLVVVKRPAKEAEEIGRLGKLAKKIWPTSNKLVVTGQIRGGERWANSRLNRAKEVMQMQGSRAVQHKEVRSDIRADLPGRLVGELGQVSGGAGQNLVRADYGPHRVKQRILQK